MARRVKVEGEFTLTTDDEDELTPEKVETLLADTLEMGMVDGETGTTYYMENGDFGVTEEAS